MTTARIRTLLAATAVAAILSYGFFGHALPQMSSHDDMAGATAGLCLLLVTVLGYVAGPKPETHGVALIPGVAPSYVGPHARPPLDARARASPSALQRFRN
jgi:hypothetical protein